LAQEKCRNKAKLLGSIRPSGHVDHCMPSAITNPCSWLEINTFRFCSRNHMLTLKAHHLRDYLMVSNWVLKEHIRRMC